MKNLTKTLLCGAIAATAAAYGATVASPTDQQWAMLSSKVDSKTGDVTVKYVVSDPDGKTRHCSQVLQGVRGEENGHGFVLFEPNRRTCTPEYN